MLMRICVDVLLEKAFIDTHQRVSTDGLNDLLELS